MIELYERENRRASTRKCNRDGRRAPAPDGAAWGECEGAQFQFITRASNAARSCNPLALDKSPGRR